jgi:predicted HicB family RNase H-like nuclease
MVAIRQHPDTTLEASMSEPRVALTLRLSASLHARIQALSGCQEISVSDFIRQATIKRVVEEERPVRELEAA